MSAWLIDTSAVYRLGRAADPAYWSNAVTRGLVRISSVTRLELGYSARSGDALRNETGRPPLSAMPTEYQTPSIEDRSLEVQLLLADRGTHRAPSIADLIVAATAEIAGLTVLHVDKDFEMIAQLTGQDVERLVTT